MIVFANIDPILDTAKETPPLPATECPEKSFSFIFLKVTVDGIIAGDLPKAYELIKDSSQDAIRVLYNSSREKKYAQNGITMGLNSGRFYSSSSSDIETTVNAINIILQETKSDSRKERNLKLALKILDKLKNLKTI